MSFAQIDRFAAESRARRKADPQKINSPAGASHLTVSAKLYSPAFPLTLAERSAVGDAS